MRRQSQMMILFGASILCIIGILVLFAPLFTSYNPILDDPTARLLPPSRAHLMGTDHFGRDIFARILYGGRITLPLAFVTITLTGCVGATLGIFAALGYGGIFDRVLMRVVDVLLAIPFMVLAMAVSAIFGRGFEKLLLIVVLVWWAPFARYTRSLVLNVKDRESILAAKVLGASKSRIIMSEILPEIFYALCIYLTLEYSSLILSISTLSFFGLGSQPPTPEWGSMLSDGRSYFLYSAHVLLWPAAFIVAVVLGLNLLGEGLRDEDYPYDLVPFGEEITRE